MEILHLELHFISKYRFFYERECLKSPESMQKIVDQHGEFDIFSMFFIYTEV